MARRDFQLRILHLASYDEWTGAAALAFEEVSALRARGVDAHYAYMGGSDLEDRVGSLDHTHPILSKNQDPVSVLRSVRAIRDLHRRLAFDIFHSHLSHDHWLALLARRKHREVSVCRTFHALRALRSDRLTKRMVDWTEGLAVSNRDLTEEPVIQARSVHFIPPAVDCQRFDQNGSDAREVHSISPDQPVIGAIGKIDEGRGFDEVIEAFARMSDVYENSRLMIVGQGEHQSALEDEAVGRGVAERIIWTGYRDDDLAEHYRAMDVLLYTRPGSEEGHRATIEALACGVPVVSLPVRGMDAVLGDLVSDLVSRDETSAALVDKAIEVLDDRPSDLADRCVSRAREFDYERTSSRLTALYGSTPGPRR